MVVLGVGDWDKPFYRRSQALLLVCVLGVSTPFLFSKLRFLVLDNDTAMGLSVGQRRAALNIGTNRFQEL